MWYFRVIFRVPPVVREPSMRFRPKDWVGLIERSEGQGQGRKQIPFGKGN